MFLSSIGQYEKHYRSMTAGRVQGTSKLNVFCRILWCSNVLKRNLGIGRMRGMWREQCSKSSTKIFQLAPEQFCLFVVYLDWAPYEISFGRN